MRELFTILESNRGFRKVYLRVESKVRLAQDVRKDVSPYMSGACFHCRNDLQRGAFRVEIPTSFLGDFANACLQHLSKVDDVTPVTELLGILSMCNRFDLTVCFMTSDERSACERLFRQLRLQEEESPDESLESAVESLAARYRVELD